MRATSTDLPVVLEGPGFSSRQAVWGEMHVAREATEVPLDLTEAFRALPGGVCPCPHWGYVVRGRVTFRYPAEESEAERELVVGAGEVYYARPGHVPSADAGSEVVELSPATAYEDLSARLAATSEVTA